jgi:hypothetical protein
LLSYLPQPRRVDLPSAPGLAKSRNVPCETCGARGRMTGSRPCASCPPQFRETNRKANHGGCKPCLVCNGTGWRKARVKDAPWDEYSGIPLATEELPAQKKRWEEMQDLERRLAHTRRLLALWEGLDTVEEGWEDVRKAMWRSGSYHDLTVAMYKQAQITPRRVSVFWHVIVLDEPVTVSTTIGVELVRTVTMLADRMPKPIKVPRHLLERDAVRRDSLWRGRTKRHEQQRADRDARIMFERDVLGWSPLKISNRHGLTKRRVNQILAGTPMLVASAPA